MLGKVSGARSFRSLGLVKARWLSCPLSFAAGVSLLFFFFICFAAFCNFEVGVLLGGGAAEYRVQ